MRAVSLWLAFGAALVAGCADAPPQVQLPHVHGVAVDPLDPTVVYVATHQGLFRAQDDAGWRQVAQEPFDMMGFTIAPDGAMYASGHPPRGGNLGVMRSDDAGRSWRVVGLAGQVDFHAMTASGADSGRVWGHWQGALWRTDDGGATWSEMGPAPAPVAALASAPGDRDVLYVAGDGVHRSRDGGTTFDVLVPRFDAANGTPSLPPTFHPIATSAAQPDLVVTHRWGQLWVTRDGGQAWTQVPSPLSPADLIGGLAIGAGDADLAYVASAGGAVHVSRDGFATWTRIL